MAAPPTTPPGAVDYSLAASAPRTFGLRPTSFTAAPPVSNTAQYIDGYQKVQDDVNGLFQFRASLPEDQDWLRKRTADRIVELSKQEDARAEAERKLQDLTTRVAAGDPKASREMAQELKSEGSWVKMLMLSYISPDLAGTEAVKLGLFNKTTTVRDAAGNIGMVTVRADGKPVSGIKADGAAMSQRELMAYTAGGALGKGTSLSAEVYVDGKTGQRYRSGYDNAGNAALVNVQGGAAFKGNPRDLTLQSVGTAQAKADIGLIADLKKKRGTDALGALSEYENSKGPLNETQRAEFLNLYGFAQAQPAAAAPAAPAVAAPAAPVAGARPIAPTPVPSGAAPAPAPVAGAATPAGPSVVSTPGTDLSKPIGEIKREGELRGKEREAVIKSNQEYTDTLNKNRSAGAAQTATINRLQTAIDKNPNFWGIDTNSTAWRAYVDANSKDADRAEALNTLARNLNIPREKRTEFDQVMNDYRNLQVTAITSSGLTVSQTNTERESQRVMGTVGSLSDRPAAAKATLEYSKAKIAYIDAKARAWAEARKRPGADYANFELDFDKTQGEKIFADANERMSTIIGGQPAGAGGGTTSSGNKFRRIQ
jgi:hypothetical protein